MSKNETFKTKKMSNNETFKTTEMGANGKVYHREVNGMRITIGKRKCFIFKEEIKDTNFDTYINHNVSDMFTGFNLSNDLNIKSACERADFMLRMYPKRIKEAERKCDLLQIKTPVNI